jgi:hypothetical protein
VSGLTARSECADEDSELGLGPPVGKRWSFGTSHVKTLLSGTHLF